jgi:type VI protein secretion system component VasF
MSHQPFETWILDSGTLSQEERRMLQAHLQSCTQCQRLERNWRSVHQELRTRPMVAPAPGFTQRWQSSLAERRAREQRKQAWRIFGILIAAAVFILLTLTGYLLATTSPTQWMANLFQTMDSSRAFMQWVVFVVQGWVSSTPLALNLALWIYLTVSLCALLLAWVGILWRTQSVGVQNQ